MPRPLSKSKEHFGHNATDAALGVAHQLLDLPIDTLIGRGRRVPFVSPFLFGNKSRKARDKALRDAMPKVQLRLLEQTTGSSRDDSVSDLGGADAALQR